LCTEISSNGEVFCLLLGKLWHLVPVLARGREQHVKIGLSTESAIIDLKILDGTSPAADFNDLVAVLIFKALPPSHQLVEEPHHLIDKG
jgi:hypothetical protein